MTDTASHSVPEQGKFRRALAAVGAFLQSLDYTSFDYTLDRIERFVTVADGLHKWCKGGRYRYYTCNSRANEGATSCKGRRIPMPVLDGIVLESLEERIFAPDRLEALLRGLLDRARNKTATNASKAKDLRKKLREVEGRIERLYAALADGTVGDTDMFRRSLTLVEAEREEALRMIAALEKHREVPRHLLTKSNIARFASAARARLRDENASLRKG